MRKSVKIIIFEIALMCFPLPGVVPELISVVCLFCIFFMKNSHVGQITITKKDTKFISVIFWFVALAVCTAIINKLELAGIVFLRGVIRSICMPAIVFITIGDDDENLSEIMKSFILYLILINAVSIILSILYQRPVSIFHYVSASENFLGCVDCITMPLLYYLISQEQRYKYVIKLCLILEVIYCLLSRCETAIIMMFVLLIGYLYFQRKVSIRIIVCTVVLMVGLFIISYIGIDRLRTIWNELLYWRIRLNTEAWEFFSCKKTSVNWFGTGTVYFPNGEAQRLSPAHNVIFEILICFGYIGLFLFIIYQIKMFRYAFNYYANKWIILLIYLAYIICGLVNPFITTNPFYGFSMAISFLLVKRKSGLKEILDEC